MSSYIQLSSYIRADAGKNYFTQGYMLFTATKSPMDKSIIQFQLSEFSEGLQLGTHDH